MMDYITLRSEIIAKIIEYYKSRFAPKEFIPGETRINTTRFYKQTMANC